MLETDLVVVGSGPAGLTAAIEAGKRGVRTILIEENLFPGGQLRKQIHKFFGSAEHFAGLRGFDIAERLFAQAADSISEVLLNTCVYGCFDGRVLGLLVDDHHSELVVPKSIVLACGALERALGFPGCTLPGVMGVGAVQTMINIHRVLPGRRFLIVGSGNVGLIVAYQLIQAGAEVAAVVEAATEVGGWRVHAEKVERLGVPILTSSTVARALGSEQIEGVAIARVDRECRVVPGTESILSVDTICVAAGLKPRVGLASQLGCAVTYIQELGGTVPIHDPNMESTSRGVFVAGDISGVGEASTAMDEGRLAGIAVAERLGFVEEEELEAERARIHHRLDALRSGPFGQRVCEGKRRTYALFQKTVEETGEEKTPVVDEG